MVYLVGSRARGEARPDSDVDVAVLPSAPLGDPLSLAAELAGYLESRLLVGPVDVVVLELGRTALPLLGAVLHDAVLLASRDEPARVAFEVQAMSLVLDFEIHAAPMRLHALQRLAAGQPRG